MANCHGPGGKGVAVAVLPVDERSAHVLRKLGYRKCFGGPVLNSEQHLGEAAQANHWSIFLPSQKNFGLFEGI